MIPGSPAYRTSAHSAMTHQGATYFGYYSQQQSHHHQYQSASDFNCNIQPLVHPTVGEAIQSGWHGYMSSHYGPHYQRQVPFDSDCSALMYPSLHHGATSAAPSSPAPQNLPPTSTSSSASEFSVSAGQLGHPSSPCGSSTVAALTNGTHGVGGGGDSGPTCLPYFDPSFCKTEYTDSMTESASPAERDAVDANPQSPNCTMLPLGGRPQPARSPYEWMKKNYQSSVPADETGYGDSAEQDSIKGKTRTKDKYRVVYSDHQRMELEKEYLFSKYITIKRKADLAALLGLSERQVKIWFQNRRAKDRKIKKKRDELVQKDKLETGVPYHHHHHHIAGHHFHPQLDLSHHGGGPNAAAAASMGMHFPYASRTGSLMVDVKPLIGSGIE